jgi:hypothetical protein
MRHPGSVGKIKAWIMVGSEQEFMWEGCACGNGQPGCESTKSVGVAFMEFQSHID